jgi:hypothetical protein
MAHRGHRLGVGGRGAPLHHLEIIAMARKKKIENSPSKAAPPDGYIEVERDHLVERLGLLKTVLVKRAHRKDLAAVHIEVKPDGSATIAAADLENSLQLKLTVLQATGPGRMMIDSHALRL